MTGQRKVSRSTTRPVPRSNSAPNSASLHFGFLMRDASQKAAQLSQGKAAVADRPAIRPYAETRVVDPEGIGFDLTQRKGWEVDVDKWEQVA